jgi:hypothetical protein
LIGTRRYQGRKFAFRRQNPGSRHVCSYQTSLSNRSSGRVKGLSGFDRIFSVLQVSGLASPIRWNNPGRYGLCGVKTLYQMPLCWMVQPTRLSGCPRHPPGWMQ